MTTVPTMGPCGFAMFGFTVAILHVEPRGEAVGDLFVSQYLPEWRLERGSVSNDIVLGHQLDLSWMTTELACETSP